MSATITIDGLDMSFGRTRALRDVTMSCRAGDVQAIAGENGAGKSTLVKIVSGVIPFGVYRGTIAIDGQPVRFANVREAEQAGIFIVPQELEIVPEMGVAEYLFLNREPRRCGIVDRATLLADARSWLDRFRLAVSPLTPMGELGSHEQQLVNIARAMTQGVKVLILDEPTASLTDRETELLFERVRAFRSLGVTTLYISHRLAEFARIADAVTVMRDGRVVDDFRVAEVEDVPHRVVRTMVGRDLDELYPHGERTIGDVALEVADWSVASPLANRRPPVSDVSFSIRAGEVLGIFGLVGSGASDLARSLFGAHLGRVTGRASIRGRAVRLTSPRRAMKAGIAYLPSDRKRDGLVDGMSIAANLTLAALADFAPWGIVDRRRELVRVRERVRALKVKCQTIEQPISDLSGGNQQKVAAAKWMLAAPEVVVVEEPTRGVDVGARIEIYNLINEIARDGKAVLIVSTDLPEVLGISDRVLAVHDGRIVGEWPRGAAGEKEVMIRAAGSRQEVRK